MSDDENQPVTKEHVEERLRHLGDLIQESWPEKLSKSELGARVREAVESSGPMVLGTKLDQIEVAIARYEAALDAQRANRFVSDALDELFGADTSPAKDSGVGPPPPRLPDSDRPSIRT